MAAAGKPAWVLMQVIKGLLTIVAIGLLLNKLGRQPTCTGSSTYGYTSNKSCDSKAAWGNCHRSGAFVHELSARAIMLESSGAGMKPTAQVRPDMVDSHQQLYSCDTLIAMVSPLPMGVRTAKALGKITLHGSVDDFELQFIHNTGGFNDGLMTELLWAIRQSQYIDQKRPLVVDIGARVGWVTANAIKAGARVVAFEDRPFNIRCLYYSFCSSPWLMDSALLYPINLGSRAEECTVVNSDAKGTLSERSCVQRGDFAPGLVMNTLNNWRATGWSDRSYRQAVLPLDNIISEHVQVLKVYMYAQGSTLDVLQGALALFKQELISYVILQVHKPMYQVAGESEVLSFLFARNFRCSYSGFQGPPIGLAGNGSLIPFGGVPDGLLYRDVSCALRTSRAH